MPGKDSDDLVTFDLDGDEMVAVFIALNPWTQDAQFSSGARGGNFWLRIVGDYPSRVVPVVRDADGKKEHVGEFRGGQCLTTVAGLHPSGKLYTIRNAGKIPEIKYSDIKLPPGWSFESRAKKHLPCEDDPGDTRWLIQRNKLLHVVPLPDGALNAQCPACAEEGHDKTGNHLRIYPGGAFHCIVGSGVPGHNRRILQLAGRRVAEDWSAYEVDLADADEASNPSVQRPKPSNPESSVGVEVKTDPPANRKEGSSVTTVASVTGVKLIRNRTLSRNKRSRPTFFHRSYAKFQEVSKVKMTPESLAGICGLAALSASLGKGIVVQSARERNTYGNLFIIGSAKSGTGKSEVFREMIAPLLDAESRRLEEWNQPELPKKQNEKEIIEAKLKDARRRPAKADLDESDDSMPYDAVELQRRLSVLSGDMSEPQWVCEDVTVERLASTLSANREVMASLSSDAGGPVNNLLGRYNKLDRTDDGLYVKLYSGDHCRIDRQSRPPIRLT